MGSSKFVIKLSKFGWAVNCEQHNLAVNYLALTIDFGS